MFALKSGKLSPNHSDNVWRATGKLKDRTSLSKLVRVSSTMLSFCRCRADTDGVPHASAIVAREAAEAGGVEEAAAAGCVEEAVGDGNLEADHWTPTGRIEAAGGCFQASACKVAMWVSFDPSHDFTWACRRSASREFDNRVSDNLSTISWTGVLSSQREAAASDPHFQARS